jgi:2-methylcitrate dehydratase PrpD
MTPAYARLCLPFLTVMMLRTGRIDPRRFTPEDFADPLLREIAAKITIEVDDNPDPNALSPQRLVIDGESIAIPHTLGSPDAPMDAHQAAQKRDLCEVLAAYIPDRRLFDDPLAYFTESR